MTSTLALLKNKCSKDSLNIYNLKLKKKTPQVLLSFMNLKENKSWVSTVDYSPKWKIMYIYKTNLIFFHKICNRID